MKTESHSIQDVLAKNATSFFIPPFQRAYAWGSSEIQRFFSDVSRIVESELDRSQVDKLEHFFGTLVIKEERSGFANTSIVVDGQQRLTSTLLFLIALRDLEEDVRNKDFITNTFLLNQASAFEDKIKLKQVTKDWDAYRALINGKQPRKGVVKSAYDLLKTLISEQKRLKPNIELNHYLIALSRINVAVIFLDERPFKGEDPQIIFETLNSLGRPLTLSDLIRNFVLLDLKSNEQTSVYEEIWCPKIENVLNEDTSKFFRDYLQYKKVKSLKVVSVNNTKELYQQFREYVKEEFRDHSDFISDIVPYVKSYKWIVTESVLDTVSEDKDMDVLIKELLRNIFHDIGTEAFKPFVLGLLHYHQNTIKGIRLSDHLLVSSLLTIRTYLIRRRVSGLTMGENQNIVTLSNRIESIAKGHTTMVDLLTKLFYVLRLPNDTDIKNLLKSIDFYKDLKRYSKFILGKIEENNTKVSVPFRSNKVTIEHIMPQKLDDDWREELGENYIEIHRKYLHNIGNLILTEFNSEIGNKSFSKKKEKLEMSSLFYRVSVLKNEKWDEQSILEHQDQMITWFLDVFSLPEEYRESANWNTKEHRSEVFSPLDADAGIMAEGNKPIEIYIENETLSVRSWHDVFIKLLKYIKDKSEDDILYIKDNQLELFRRPDTIITWSHLKKKINEDSKVANRFKSFEGEKWDKVKDLREETDFIHVNMSASQCMLRIANLMRVFDMSVGAFRIRLR